MAGGEDLVGAHLRHDVVGPGARLQVGILGHERVFEAFAHGVRHVGDGGTVRAAVARTHLTVLGHDVGVGLDFLHKTRTSRPRAMRLPRMCC